MKQSQRIRIGPAGWSYKDWEGTVYPASPGRGFDQLAYIAELFDTVEVNSSFYRTPPPTHSSSWLRRTALNRRVLARAIPASSRAMGVMCK